MTIQLLWLFLILGLLIALWALLREIEGYREDTAREIRIKKALTALKGRKRITNQEYRKLAKVSQSTATRDLDILETENRIQQVSKGKYTYYRVLKR